jgi:hypothetical protein
MMALNNGSSARLCARYRQPAANTLARHCCMRLTEAWNFDLWTQSLVSAMNTHCGARWPAFIPNLLGALVVALLGL